MLPGLAQPGGQVRAVEQLGGVGGRLADSQEVEVGIGRDHRRDLIGAGEHGAQAMVSRHPHLLRLGRMPHVGIHQQHLGASRGERDREARSHAGLALIRAGRGDHQAAAGLQAVTR